MPPDKRYDATALLEGATRAFWRRGFAATSVGELVSETGVNRASLYAAHAGKRALFLACLRHYDETRRRRFLDVLSAHHPPRAAILAAFEAARLPGEDGLPGGCLLVNTALELAPHDPEIRALIGDSLTAVEAFFRDRIEAAQVEGTVPPGRDPAGTARSLLGLFLGLRVLVRAEIDGAAVRAVVAEAEALLS